MLLREDGTRVQNTLSEGERSFVTFLYFYYLLKGNHEQSKTNEDTVVVFDDPVSSLDSDTLFIVSTLVRRLCEEAGKKTGTIKQVFVMTHNVYFHKEVTFRSGDLGGQETFWLVQKPDATSRVQLHEKNPVQTSYRFMWDELQRNSDNARVIQNTMRRILEHYFKALGELGWDDLTDKLPEADHLTARSLLAWVHDGSHSAEEDLFICTDGCAETFLRVFRGIFVKNGHESHYLMMCSDEMKEKYLADKAEATTTDSELANA